MLSHTHTHSTVTDPHTHSSHTHSTVTDPHTHSSHTHSMVTDPHTHSMVLVADQSSASEHEPSTLPGWSTEVLHVATK